MIHIKMAKKVMFILIIGVVLGGLTWGAYVVLERFLQDRQSAMNFEKTRPSNVQRARNQVQQRRTYTPEELEKARQEGTLPQGLKQLPPVPTPNTSDSIQRTLRTVDEINRINEMNRRLMEQQQKNQNLK